MKKIIPSGNITNTIAIVFFAMVLMSPKLFAQLVNTYTFTQTTGTYTQITGTVLAGSNNNSICPPGGPQSSPVPCSPTSYNIPIPFTFKFAGVNFTNIQLSPFGYAWFGTTYQPYNSTNPLNELRYAVAIFAQSFTPNNPNHDIQYAVSGTTPNRVLTIQYKNWGMNGGNINFQLKLLETSNILKMVYGTVDTLLTLSYPKVGISGNTNYVAGAGVQLMLDFNNRYTHDFWSSSSRGTVIGSTQANFSIIKPNSGLTYTFTPPVACSGTPVAGTVVSTLNPVIKSGCPNAQSFVLTTIGTEATGINYQWQSSTNNINWTNISGANTFYCYQAPIASAKYYRCRITCTAGGAVSFTPSFLQGIIGCTFARVENTNEMLQSNASDTPIGAIKDTYSFAYPNPTASEITMEVNCVQEKMLTMELYDLSGVKVREQIFSLESGFNLLKVSLGDRKYGMYLLRLLDENNNVVYSQTVVKE